ncbi:hypothetical protein F5Y13DRAFT_192579 [Hypoxylon sp. FL1857]|nr:hypothetical protein F5Y13DRAFT_192579 [Hypoxylon sp. FL1857]
MGRWGMRLFDGDQDLDITAEIERAFGKGADCLNIYGMIHQHGEELEKIVAQTRAKLDVNSLGHKLIRHWRGKEHEYGGKYRVIVAGALLMFAGAKIAE